MTAEHNICLDAPESAVTAVKCAANNANRRGAAVTAPGMAPGGNFLMRGSRYTRTVVRVPRAGV